MKSFDEENDSGEEDGDGDGDGNDKGDGGERVITAPLHDGDNRHIVPDCSQYGNYEHIRNAFMNSKEFMFDSDKFMLPSKGGAESIFTFDY